MTRTSRVAKRTMKAAKVVRARGPLPRQLQLTIAELEANIARLNATTARRRFEELLAVDVTESAEIELDTADLLPV